MPSPLDDLANAPNEWAWLTAYLNVWRRAGGGSPGFAKELMSALTQRGWKEPSFTPDFVDVRACNRSACRAMDSGVWWWNQSTHAWYCDACARQINDGEGGTPYLCIAEYNLPPKESA